MPHQLHISHHLFQSAHTILKENISGVQLIHGSVGSYECILWWQNYTYSMFLRFFWNDLIIFGVKKSKNKNGSYDINLSNTQISISLDAQLLLHNCKENCINHTSESLLCRLSSSFNFGTFFRLSDAPTIGGWLSAIFWACFLSLVIVRRPMISRRWQKR